VHGGFDGAVFGRTIGNPMNIAIRNEVLQRRAVKRQVQNNVSQILYKRLEFPECSSLHRFF
jgi:hypothetical protein